MYIENYDDNQVNRIEIYHYCRELLNIQFIYIHMYSIYIHTGRLDFRQIFSINN